MAATAYKANVITSSMEIYSYTREPIGSLSRGTEFFVLDISDNGNWAKIYYNGHVGFASMQDIMFQNVIKAVCTQDTQLIFATKSSFKEREAYKGKIGMGTLVNVVGYHDGLLLLMSDSGKALGVVSASCFKKLK